MNVFEYFKENNYIICDHCDKKWCFGVNMCPFSDPFKQNEDYKDGTKFKCLGKDNKYHIVKMVLFEKMCKW